MHLPLSSQRGFTLVETLTYGAGLVIILGGLSIFLFYLYSWYRTATIPTRADAAGLTLMSQITNDIRVANTINSIASSFNVANGVISMTTSSGSNSTTTVYSLENGHIVSKVGTAATSTVSAADSYISGFYIQQLTTPNSIAVRVEIDIDYSIKGATSTNVYSDLAILRQSYE
ncbi:MAG TPA: hypothetical protein VF438_03680 [Candidatus Paceibacterota bacterium]